MTLTPLSPLGPLGAGDPLRPVRPDPDAGPLGDLARFGDLPALRAGDNVVSYRALAARVRDRAEQLGPVRRLVLLECSNDLETVTTYLAALAAAHPVLLAGAGTDLRTLSARYRPDVVATADGLEEREEGTRHRLHPDLSLLLSTSGSTGAPKLVRLSADNVRSNAESIATYLRLDTGDLAATTLPLHYCYGLSVLNSHLVRGAGVLLTDRSVVAEELWDDFRAAGATSFAGVPYTFDLLDASGFAERDLPSLRYVTAAGGRLDPERVQRYARLGRRRGFDLVVMYGQTEATARMAYLPPRLAEERPTTIGVPVPGGSFRLDPVDRLDRAGGGDPVGELVYRGPNVMLGYATCPADLAQGRTVHELRTGDLAVQHDDGLFEVVGRRSRLAKVFGLRVDLDDLERRLEAEAGVRVCAVQHDDGVVLFVPAHRHVDAALQAAARLGVPARALRAHVVASLPRTDSQKVDHAALVRQAEVLRACERPPAAPAVPTATALAPAVRDLYAGVLGRPDATEDDSFVALGGDSLSFVEVSVRLEALLGRLPDRWPDLSARRLAEEAGTGPGQDRRHGAGRASGQGTRWARVEVPLLLRAAAIVLVVASHADLIAVLGGAHVLLAVAGVSLARFQLSSRARSERRRSLVSAAARIAVPSALWIGGVALATGSYDLGTAVLANNLVGSPSWDVRWQFWFLEAVVWSLVGTAVLVSVPALDRLERRQPFWCAAAVLALALGLRFALVGVHAGATERYALPVVLWCVALGWLAERCGTTSHRVLATAAAALATYGFFDDVVRETLVVAGVACVVWLRSVRVPRALLRPVSVLASSSLFVYLTHWQVYPHLEDDHPLLATLASFAVGIAVHRAYTTARRSLRTRARRAPSPTGPSPRRSPAPR